MGAVQSWRLPSAVADAVALRRGACIGRRRFLVLVGGALAAPFAVAQQRSVRRVGFLGFADSFSKQSPLNYAWSAIEEILAREGFRENENLVIERRHASGKQSELGNAARELVALKPEVVVVFGSQGIDAVRAADREMPIVGYTSDAVALGYAATYARPGGKITGASASTLAMTVKELEFLVALVPGLQRVAWLRNSPPGADRGQKAFAARTAKDIEQASAQLGVIAVPFDATAADKFEGVIGEIARQGFGAVLIPADIMYVVHRKVLSAGLIKHRLPSASMDIQMLDAGVLVIYGAVLLDGIRRMGEQVVKILRGVPPGVIPFEFTERFQFGINLKTAGQLGITVPNSFLLRADRVIE
jgi:putative ABC transport system substrate-binding protein